MKRFFTDHDLLIVPTSPTTAFPHNTPVIDIEGHEAHGRDSLRITVPFDLTGSPAISVPFGWSDEGLPIGVQLVGRHFDEATVLHAAAHLESVRAGAERRPEV